MLKHKSFHLQQKEGNKLYDVPATLMKETDKAILISVKGTQFWLPKSQASMSDDGKNVTAPAWLLDKALIPYSKID